MSETKFYIGQPVRYTFSDADETLVVLWDGESRNWFEPAPGLPNVWYQWNGDSEPPCDPDQDVLVQFRDGVVSDKHPAHTFVWGHSFSDYDIVFYMIIKAPEVPG